MKHIKIVNREESDGLPITAIGCTILNACIGGDWDNCNSTFDFCIKAGEKPADNNN